MSMFKMDQLPLTFLYVVLLNLTFKPQYLINELIFILFMLISDLCMIISLLFIIFVKIWLVDSLYTGKTFKENVIYIESSVILHQ